MEYIVETSLENFKAWSGGKDTLDEIKDNADCELVEQLIEESFAGETPTETGINDFLWFERDYIAEHLGYIDWEWYEKGVSKEDLEDMESWWEGLDESDRAKLSGLDDEDEQSEWWDDKSEEEKWEIYKDAE